MGGTVFSRVAHPLVQHLAVSQNLFIHWFLQASLASSHLWIFISFLPLDGKSLIKIGILTVTGGLQSILQIELVTMIC